MIKGLGIRCTLQSIPCLRDARFVTSYNTTFRVFLNQNNCVIHSDSSNMLNSTQQIQILILIRTIF